MLIHFFKKLLPNGLEAIAGANAIGGIVLISFALFSIIKILFIMKVPVFSFLTDIVLDFLKKERLYH